MSAIADRVTLLLGLYLAVRAVGWVINRDGDRYSWVVPELGLPPFTFGVDVVFQSGGRGFAGFAASAFIVSAAGTFLSSLACVLSQVVYCCHLRYRLRLDRLGIGLLWAFFSSPRSVAIYAYLVRLHVPSACSLCEDFEGAFTIRAYGFPVLIRWGGCGTGLCLLLTLEG